MKAFYILIFYLFSTHNVSSQNARIIGTISDDSYASVILSPSIYSKLIDSKTEINSKRGAFEFPIQVSYPSFYRLYYKEKRISIYVEPNKTIQLSIDNSKASDFVNFYGDLAKENSFLNQGNIPMIGTSTQRDYFKEKAQEGKDAYLNAVKSEMVSQNQAFDKLAANFELGSTFSDLYRKNNIEMAGVLYMYYYAKFAPTNPDSFIAVSSDFRDIFNYLPKSEDGYQGSLLYFENRMNDLKSKVMGRFKDQYVAHQIDDLQLYKAYYQEASMLPVGEMRDLIRENILGEWVSYYGRAIDMKAEILDYIQSIPDGAKKDAVVQKIRNLSEYEMNKPAPIFSFEDNAGNVRNLKELVGKVVFIEAWASWNKASTDEIPYSKKLYEKYKDNPDIQFLYISLDENKQNWQNALRQNMLNNGLQGIVTPGGFNSDFAQKYAIQNLPTYIIIDKSGNMIHHRAPKPSQTEKIYILLDTLLKTKTDSK